MPPAPPGGGSEPPSAASVDQFKKVKGCLERLLKGLAVASPNEKEIASDTRTAVSEIKQLAKLQKPLFPSQADAVEDSASELVVAVKAVLVARKTSANELATAKGKLAQCIETVRNQCIRSLGPNANLK
jgi:hypothetical protein